MMSGMGQGAQGNVLDDEVAPPLKIPEGLDCGVQTAVPSEARLLTRVQYDNVVRDVFPGVEIQDLTADFPPENKVYGFGTNQAFHRATPLLVEEQMQAAESVSEAVVAALDGLVDCGNGTDMACAKKFLDEYGTRAFRRPLTDDERLVLLGLFEDTAASHGLSEGIALLTQAMLQAPQFLYRLEQSGVGAAPDKAVQVDGYELASRLSFLIWNSIPDQELLDRAGDGSLTAPDELTAQAVRMLDDPRAIETFVDFHRQWLEYERLPGIAREMEVEGDASQLYLGESWERSLDAFVRSVLTGPAPTLSELLTAPRSYVDAQLAPLYGVAVPNGADEQPFAASLGTEPRLGVLTQPGTMALLAHPDQSSPVLRGVFVLDRILCTPPSPPPPDLAIVAPDPSPMLSTRDRFAVHTQEAACSGCHRYIDPVGFTFEGFDHLGRYRLQENGESIDESGAIVDSAADLYSAALEGPVSGPAELVQRLGASSQVRQCLAAQWYRYSVGRVEKREDLCSLVELSNAFDASSGDMRELMLAMVRTDAFRYRLGSSDEAEGEPQ